MPIIDYYRSSIEIFIFIITENNFFLTNKGIKDLFVALLMISKQNYLITGNHVKTSELQTRIIFKCKFADYKCKKKISFYIWEFRFSLNLFIDQHDKVNKVYKEVSFN